MTFTNVETGEYQFAELKIQSVRPKSLSVIRLEARIRSSANHRLELKNTLSIPTTVTFQSTVPELICPSQFHLPAASLVSTHSLKPLVCFLWNIAVILSCWVWPILSWTVDKTPFFWKDAIFKYLLKYWAIIVGFYLLLCVINGDGSFIGWKLHIINTRAYAKI